MERMKVSYKRDNHQHYGQVVQFIEVSGRIVAIVLDLDDDQKFHVVALGDMKYVSA